MKCHFIRFRISRRLDDGGRLSPPLERHLGHCPECAAWHRSQQALVRQLRGTAAVAPPTGEAENFPVFFQAKILRALRQPPIRPLPRIFSWNGPVTAVAATAVGMATGIILFTWQQTAQPPDSSRQSPLADTGTTSPPHSNPGIFPPPAAVNAAKPHPGPVWKAAVSLDQPLRRELALLNADAMAAVRGLKSSILPEGL